MEERSPISFAGNVVRDMCIKNSSIRISIRPNDIFSEYKNEKRLPVLFCLSSSPNVKLISGVLVVLFLIDQSTGLSLQAACVGSLVLHRVETPPGTELLWQEKAYRSCLNISYQRISSCQIYAFGDFFFLFSTFKILSRTSRSSYRNTAEIRQSVERISMC